MSYDLSDTDQLLSRVATGDSRALGLLIDRHRPRLRRMVRARMDERLRTRVDPSDVVQQTMAKAAGKMVDYLQTRPLPFYPWLRQLAWQELVHLQDRHVRAARRSVTREESPVLGLSDESSMLLVSRIAGAEKTPSAHAVEQETRHRIQQAIDRLSREQRELLILRHVEQLSSREIGQVMGLSEAAVNMRHMRVVEKLRHTLEKGGFEE